MVLKLYGTAISTNTQHVAVALKEKQVPFEFVFIDLAKGEHKSPEFLKKQPFGQIPYIVEDDGFTLYEGRAIAKYIASRYHKQGTPLVPDPSDIKATALYEQAASIELSNFNTFARVVVWERFYKG